MTAEQVEEDDDGVGAGGRGGVDDEDEEEDEGDIPATTTEDVELRWVQVERLLLERAFGLHLQGLIVPSFYVRLLRKWVFVTAGCYGMIMGYTWRSTHRSSSVV